MSRRGQPKNTEGRTRDINAAVRVQTALKLSAQGYSWDEIATKAGYASRGAAHTAVMRELDRNVAKDVDELRTRELYMLNQLHAAIWPMAIGEVVAQPVSEDKENEDEENGRKKRRKEGPSLFAIDRILAISERRAKLLGLDTPVSTANIASAQVVIREVPPGYMGAKT